MSQKSLECPQTLPHPAKGRGTRLPFPLLTFGMDHNHVFPGRRGRGGGGEERGGEGRGGEGREKREERVSK